MKKILIVGAGGFGREVLSLLNDLNSQNQAPSFEIVGFVADETPEESTIKALGVRYLGSLSYIYENFSNLKDCYYILAIGNGSARKRIAARLNEIGLRAITLIHPSAIIGQEVVFESGVIVCANSVITTNVKIESHTHINIGCIIGHDVRVGSFVTLSPAVKIMGNCQVDELSTIYTGAILIPNIRIEKNSTIGAGSVVTKNIEANSTAVGIPAKVINKDRK